jgi:serine/threonine-protein kinase
VSLPEGQSLTPAGRRNLAISPDGANLVYVANNRLMLRPMSGLDGRVIQGSDTLGAIQEPVFSPEGDWIAFRSIADTRLKRLPVAGGAAVTISPVEQQPLGISWGEPGILFGQLGKGILRVSPNGGVPEVVVAADTDEMVEAPQWLADGRAVLFSSKKATEPWDKARIVVYTIADRRRTVVIDGGADGRYLPSGHLVYVVSGVLYAVPFDVSTFTVQGGSVAVVEGVRRTAGAASSGGIANYAVSSNGSLAFIPGPTTGASLSSGLDLAVFDGTGPPVSLKLPPGPYAAPRVSPDGRWVAFEREDDREANVLLYELAGTSAVRQLTFGGRNRAPVWSGDSRWIAFQSDREGDLAIFRQRADGAGTPERLTKADRGVTHIPQSWSPDGGHLLFTVQAAGEYSLVQLTLKDQSTSPFSNVRAPTLVQATFSPDGRWVAYQLPRPGGTDGGSANFTYIEPFPPTGAKYVVPMPAGHPHWSRKGDRLLFENGPVTTASIPVTTSPVFSFGRPQESPRGARLSANSVVVRRNSDSLPDGRILGLVNLENAQGGAVPQITVVLNWLEELKQRVPTR